MRCFLAPFGEKGVDGRFGFASDQLLCQGPRLRDNFLDRPDADPAAIEFHHDIAAAFKTDGFAKLRRNAEPPGFGNAPTYGNHWHIFWMSHIAEIWR